MPPHRRDVAPSVGALGGAAGGAMGGPAASALRFSSPAEYERMLRAAHELTLAGVPQPGIAPGVRESWRRSLAAGIDPDRHRPRHLHEVTEAVTLRRGHRLETVMPALSELLADEGSGGQHLLVLADAHGEVLWRVGSRSVLRRADGLEFVEGADWSEAGVGTNAISEVLISGLSAQLVSAEHLVRSHHDWACTASPIRDPLTGEILGVLNVSGPLDTVTADSVRMVKVGVRLAEELLRAHPAERTAFGHEAVPATGTGAGVSGAPAPGAGRNATGPDVPGRGTAGPGAPVIVTSLALHLFGDKPAVVFPDGRRVALSLRRAEILALLDSRRRGWSADELAYEVHGETGAASTIRIEMHRIRGLLGGLVDSNPYRLADAAQGTSDVGRVLRLVRAGHPAEALDAYTAPLLDRSSAPAIGPLRAELDDAVGASVRASGSAELLRRWCATDMGSADEAAVRELGRLAGPQDAAYLSFRARAARRDREFGA